MIPPNEPPTLTKFFFGFFFGFCSILFCSCSRRFSEAWTIDAVAFLSFPFNVSELASPVIAICQPIAIVEVDEETSLFILKVRFDLFSVDVAVFVFSFLMLERRFIDS